MYFVVCVFFLMISHIKKNLKFDDKLESKFNFPDSALWRLSSLEILSSFDGECKQMKIHCIHLMHFL